MKLTYLNLLNASLRCLAELPACGVDLDDVHTAASQGVWAGEKEIAIPANKFREAGTFRFRVVGS